MALDDERIWLMYFAGVASLRFHPRNISFGDAPEGPRVESEIWLAKQIADLMLQAHRSKFPWRG